MSVAGCRRMLPLSPVIPHKIVRGAEYQQHDGCIIKRKAIKSPGRMGVTWPKCLSSRISSLSHDLGPTTSPGSCSEAASRLRRSRSLSDRFNIRFLVGFFVRIFLRFSRAFDRFDLEEPTEIPRCLAISSWVSPSMTNKLKTVRYAGDR